MLDALLESPELQISFHYTRVLKSVRLPRSATGSFEVIIDIWPLNVLDLWARGTLPKKGSADWKLGG